MPNPVEVFGDTGCDMCGEVLFEGDKLFFHDGQKLCEACAEENENVCECGNYKKSQYDECYSCHSGEE